MTTRHSSVCSAAARRAAAIALAAVAATACAPPSPSATSAPPDTTDTTDAADAAIISTVGHGAFLGAGGALLTPSVALFRRTQRQYLARLAPIAEATRGSLTAQRLAAIAAAVPDELLADALQLDWLIDEIAPPERATMRAVNNAMRQHYLDRLAPSALDRAERHATKGLGHGVVQRLAASGVEVNVATGLGGAKYIAECAAAGVPIPPASFSGGWTRRGYIDNEFLSPGEDAELWEYRSTKPAGVCLTLPRYFAGTDDIDVMGVICLGTVSNKACFWDNPKPVTFRRGVPVPLTEFVGGADLVANGQGVCSDCHAGENPFVVHPEAPAFAGFSVYGTRWYDPIVDASWPQNPGPTNLLAGEPSTGRCDDCHAAGRTGGRFPALSTELPGYCDKVLGTAALYNAPNGTMPPFGLARADFLNHIGALARACAAPPATGTVVPVERQDEIGFLSPPIVIDPLYACASQVAVRGAVLGAKVFVAVNGSTVAAAIARNPDQVVLDVPPLVAGDVVTARQEWNGTASGASAAVIVRDHRADYPAGLPAPAIDPTLIHECADLIAVRHVPGAQVTVYVNGGAPVTGTGATGWTSFRPGRWPFSVGDSFTAEAKLCSDRSPTSSPATAVAAPRTMPAPIFDPPQVYAGQELISLSGLVHGAHTTLRVSGAPAGELATPISWFPNYDLATALGRPLIAGDTVAAQQKLCVAGPEIKTPPTTPCEALPPPRILTPIAGATYVVVWQAVPGARIRIYDGGGAELGDGSGDVIVVRRPLVAGESLTVTQQVGDCTGRSGYRISVGKEGKQ